MNGRISVLAASTRSHLNYIPSLVTISILGLVAPPWASPQSTLRKVSGVNQHFVHNLVDMPVVFEANHGQTDPRVLYLMRSRNYMVFLTGNEAVFALGNRTPVQVRPTASRMVAQDRLGSTAVAMRLVGSSPTVRIMGEAQLPGTVNYLPDNDRAHWLTGVATFARVRYSRVYPGVDLVYYGSQKQLEYDFVISPHANASQIQLRFSGTRNLSIYADGNVSITTSNGAIIFRRPFAYQEQNGIRTQIVCTYELTGKNALRFRLGPYNHSLPVTIDPILDYSTYLGSPAGGVISDVAADATGDAYVTGSSFSCQFPTTPGTLEPQCGLGQVEFVAKINPAGTGLVYATYLGPSGVGGLNNGIAIAVDPSGDAYVAGAALAGMPVSPDAFQTRNMGQGISGYVAKLNPNGSQLIYATYLGGTYGADAIYGIALDSTGAAYLAGTAMSSDFPTTSAAFETVDTTPGEPYSFVSKLKPDGTGLDYSTYLVGKGVISGFSAPTGAANRIAVDSNGNAYVAGVTADTTFPVTPGAFQTTYSTNPSNPILYFRFTGYIVKLDPTGAREVYSSFIGGTYIASAEDVAVDPSGNAYVTGWTYGDNVTTPDSFQPFSAAVNAFVAKINPAGSAFVYSTYLGGSCILDAATPGDAGYGIAIDNLGNAYVSGQTCSYDFPVTTNAVQTGPEHQSGLLSEAFLSVLNPNGSALIYSTYMGGTGYTGDLATSIALDASNNVYLAGFSHSTDYPTTPGAIQSKGIGAGTPQGFVSKFSIPPNGVLLQRDFTMSLNPSTATISEGQSAATSVALTPENGFIQPVTLSCSGLPSWAYCNFDSDYLNLGTIGTTVALTVQTTQHAAKLNNRGFPLFQITSLATLVICCGFGCKSRRKYLAVILSAGIGFSALIGCSSGSEGAQSITATITAQGLTVMHSAPFTIDLK